MIATVLCYFFIAEFEFETTSFHQVLIYGIAWQQHAEAEEKLNPTPFHSLPSIWDILDHITSSHLNTGMWQFLFHQSLRTCIFLFKLWTGWPQKCSIKCEGQKGFRGNKEISNTRSITGGKQAGHRLWLCPEQPHSSPGTPWGQCWHGPGLRAAQEHSSKATTLQSAHDIYRRTREVSGIAASDNMALLSQ